MVGSILNSSILISAILDSAILHKKKFHSFILTQLDDDSHLEFCHVGFRHFHLGFRHLVIFFQIHSKPLLLHSDFDSNKFNLTQTHSFSFNLMMAAILISDNLNFTILDSAILVFPLKLTHTCQDWFPPFAQKKLHSFILTQLDDCSHLEFCHLGFRHLIFFSEIHLETLFLSIWLWLKVNQSDSNSFILI